MNGPLFSEHTDMLIDILDNSNIDLTEKKFRKDTLLNVYNKMKQTNIIDNRYYQLSHEIRSLEFLNNIGSVKIAKDSSGKAAGCDFVLNTDYQVECVCSSTGDEKSNGFHEYSLKNTINKGIIDYGKKEKIILTRFSSSIEDKLSFYNTHVINKTISENNPYVIFLGIGNLSYETFPGTFGFVLNEVLFGVGHERLYIDKDTNKHIKTDYEHNMNIFKHNGAEIDCNIFANPRYIKVSGIVFSIANLDERYNKNNTFLFINPFAKNKIKAKKFGNVIYWRKDKKDSYIPRYKGKNLNYKLAKKYF